jgi:hypothetical protein
VVVVVATKAAVVAIGEAGEAVVVTRRGVQR